MEQAQAASNRLADATEARLVSLWALVESGGLTLARFRALAASLIATANQAGVQLADIALSAEITRQLGRPTAPIGLRPTPVQVDRERITANIDTILQGADPVASLGRLARSEPLLTVATAVQAGMRTRGAQGWVRQTSGKSCALCTSWADGVVRPTSVRMARHPGCDCIQAPTFT